MPYFEPYPVFTTRMFFSPLIHILPVVFFPLRGFAVLFEVLVIFFIRSSSATLHVLSMHRLLYNTTVDNHPTHL